MEDDGAGGGGGGGGEGGDGDGGGAPLLKSMLLNDMVASTGAARLLLVPAEKITIVGPVVLN